MFCASAIPMKFFSFLAVAALVLVAGVWHLGGTSAITNPIANAWQAGSISQLMPTAVAPQQQQPSTAPRQVYKCVNGARVTYSDSACAAGYQQQPVKDDRVTVMEAQRTAAADTLASSAPSAHTLKMSNGASKRRFIGIPSDPASLEQEIDQATR